MGEGGPPKVELNKGGMTCREVEESVTGTVIFRCVTSHSLWTYKENRELLYSVAVLSAEL